jgi:hypothetical protein
MTVPERARHPIMLLAAALLCLGMLTAITTAASAASSSTASAASSSTASAASGTGWVRLAHLSPNTPAVDVYLYSFGDPSAQVVLKHVSYGTVSPYEPISSGEYTVAMRAAGAASSAQPVLSTDVQVGAGHSYTVAGMGPESGLRLQVLDDQLTTPQGHALVRVIQASLQDHVVKVTFGGSVLAPSLSFATATSYLTVSPATRTVHVTGGSAGWDGSISLAADTIHTLVVLDGSDGLHVTDLEDAAGSRVMPAGAAATGLGGTAPRPGGSSGAGWLVAVAAGALAAAAGAFRLRRIRLAAMRVR